ncbi:hypothetical protein ACWATR_21435 [Nostoc sp. UIC 10890]
MSDDKKQSFYAFCCFTECIQDAQRLNIAAGVDKITDSKHKTQRYDKLVAYL